MLALVLLISMGTLVVMRLVLAARELAGLLPLTMSRSGSGGSRGNRGNGSSGGSGGLEMGKQIAQDLCKLTLGHSSCRISQCLVDKRINDSGSHLVPFAKVEK
jgi:hypothetical protein